MMAARAGQLSLVQLLLEKRASINKNSITDVTPLMLAASSGNTEIADLLIRSGAAVNQADNNGWTPLVFAAKHGHTALAKFLIDSKADIDQTNHRGETPLMIAARKGHTELARLLIQEGAATNQENADGWTAQMIACQCGRVEIVDLLMDKAGFSISQLATMISTAAFNGHAKVLELLFEKAKTSALFSKTMLRYWDSNPAEFAIKNGHADALAVLMKNGIRPDLSSQTVWQDLMKAIDKGNAELLHLATDELPSSLLWSSLSSFGQGTSPVHLHVQQALIHAIRQDRMDIVKLLMKAGAKPDFVDKNATTPVQVAIQEGNLPMLQLLLGPDVKLTRHKPDDKLSAELLLAISSEPPDPLLIDTLIDFDNAALMKKGGFGFKLDFQQLADRASQLLMAAQKD